MILFLEGRESVYVLYIALALGVFLLVTGLGQLLSRGENRSEARNRRMRMIGQGASTAEVLALLKPAALSGGWSRIPFASDLPKTLRQAGMTIAPSRFLLGCTIGFVVFGVAGLRLLPPLQALGAAVVLAFLLPVGVVKSKRKSRTDKLTAQLPDALDLMARGLKVGHPLNTSIGSVAREMPDPVGTEFGLIFDQISYGDDLVDAFQEFSERVDIEDVHYLTASIAIQNGTGGDLGRVLEILSKVVRGRIAMRRRIQAISSEGRLSAYFLSALPFVIYGFTSISSPDYYRGVSDDPLFVPMMSLIAFFVVTNALVLRRLVNFRI